MRFCVVLTRGDVRHIAQDGTCHDELKPSCSGWTMLLYMAHVTELFHIVNELMEEKRASRHVTVPAVMLEKVMALAGSEMKRL
ncbi:hypothetical protein ECOPMV1_pHUSEC411like00019 (plasmid) [Escherichia coli PMV-1]|nr:hypothetical protein ECOPMV1_pHUSEC411like00019 [Escherichia coli PMV-1]